MKLLAIFCLFGFAAAASQQGILKPGHSYTFHYEGRLLTGLPQLAPHYSGLGIASTVKVEVQSTQEYRIQVTDARFAKVNQELQAEGTDVSRNWRNIYLPSYVPVPSDLSRHLQQPALLKLDSRGKFEFLEVNKEEPEWSVNFKKALALIFSTQTVEQESSLIQNMIEEESILSDESLTYWKTEEQSLEGLCEVTYQVNELPEYIVARENHNIIPYNKTCTELGSGVKYFEIVRSRDVNTCQRRGIYSFYKPGHMRCHLGNCESQMTRSSVSRYVACGTGRTDLRVQTISNEGEIEFDLIGSNTERFVTGNKQNLTLVDMKSGSMGIQKPSNPIKTTTLAFELKQEISRLPSIVNKITGAKLPEGPEALKVNLGQKDINPTDLVNQMINIFQEVVTQDLELNQSQPDKELPIKMLSLARGFSLLGQKQHIEDLYSKLKQKFQSNPEQEHTMKNVFFDTLLLGGTHLNFKFVIEKIESGEIGDFQAASLFTAMPNYVAAPTEQLLEEIFNMVKSGSLVSGQRSSMVYQQAILGLSSLVHKACVSEEREQSYPVGIYGEMCHTESNVVVQELIPYLKSQLDSAPATGDGQKEGKDLYILALGLVGHKNTLPVLLPYLQTGTTSGSGSSSSITGEEAKFLRYLTVFSIRNVGMRYPGLAEPILFSVLSNPSEMTELRAAAFRCLISLNPSETYLHRIAVLTWFEKDEELLKVIDSAFWTLSSRRDFEPLRTSYSSLSRKAFVIYPLLRRSGADAVYTSGSYYSVDFLPELNNGYFESTSWTSTGRSYVPTDFFRRMTLLFNRYQLTAYEMGYRLVGGETLLQHAVEMLTPNQQHQGSQHYEQLIKNRDLSPEFKEIIEKLGLKIDESDKGLLSLYLNFVESTPLFKTLRSGSASSLKEQVQRIIKKDPSQLMNTICGEHKVNVQRVFSLHTGVKMIPNDMGFPIFMETHMPAVISVRGTINVECGSGRIIPKFNVEGKKLWEGAFTAFVGTIVPFNGGHFASTGVEQSILVNVPVHFQVDGDTEQQKVTATFKSTGSGSSVDVLHYRSRPYTLVKKIEDLTPFSKVQDFKTIKSATNSVGKEWNTYGRYMGLDLTLGIKSETRFLDFRTISDKLNLYKYNPLNLLRFGTAPTALSEHLRPSVRFHEYYVKFNPSSSQTKEVDIEFKWGSATKMMNGTISYDMLKIKKGGQEELESYPEWKKIVPAKWESAKIEEVSIHPNRRNVLKTTLEKLNLKSGSGQTYTFVVKTRGGQQREYDLTVTKATGEEHTLKQKWHLTLESSKTQNKFCLNGHLTLPHMPIWKVDEIRSTDSRFDFENVIGFGKSCEETKVIVRGNAESSQKQKEYSRRSGAAKLHQQLKSQNVPLADMSRVAEMLIEQASTLDKYDFTVQYQNAGKWGEMTARYFSEYLKAFLWPNMQYKSYFPTSGTPLSASGSFSTQNKWHFEYDPETNTVDITLNKETPSETVHFRHVRLPRFLGHFFPATAVGLTKMSQGGVIPHKAFPTCKLEGSWMQSLNNATVRAELDTCFHLLSADASYKKTFAILERNISNSRDSTKELKALFGKTSILLTPLSGSAPGGSGSPGVSIKVNGSEIHVSAGQSHKVLDFNQTLVAEIFVSKDKVVSVHGVYCPVLKKMSVVAYFDGVKTELKLSPMFAGKLTGMCGKMNGLRLGGLVGPQGCAHSKPELLTASYRVSTLNKTCSPLPSKIETELKKEQSECLKVKETGSGDLLKALEGQVGPCTQHVHQIVDQVDKYCFSRVPVIGCSPLCKPTQTVTKSVSFGCLPKGRLSERYAEMIRRGENVEELKNLKEEFSTKFAVPQSCGQI